LNKKLKNELERIWRKNFRIGFRLERKVYPILGISIFDKNDEEIYFVSESYLHRNIDWEKDYSYILGMIKDDSYKNSR